MNKFLGFIIMEYFYYMDKYLDYLQQKNKIEKALEKAKKIQPEISEDIVIFYGYVMMRFRIILLQLLKEDPIMCIIGDLKSLLDALENNRAVVLENKKMTDLYAKISNKFSIIFQQEKVYELALLHYEETLALYAYINDKEKIIRISLCIAEILRDSSKKISQEEQTKIEKNIYKAFNVASKKKDLRLVLCCQIEFLKLYEKFKKYYLFKCRIEIIEDFLKDNKISNKKFSNEIKEYEKIKERNERNVINLS